MNDKKAKALRRQVNNYRKGALMAVPRKKADGTGAIIMVQNTMMDKGIYRRLKKESRPA